MHGCGRRGDIETLPYAQQECLALAQRQFRQSRVERLRGFAAGQSQQGAGVVPLHQRLAGGDQQRPAGRRVIDRGVRQVLFLRLGFGRGAHLHVRRLVAALTEVKDKVRFCVTCGNVAEADYLAIATLAFAEVLRVVAINWESVTAGTIGIFPIPQPVEFNPPSAFLNAMVKVAIGAGVLLILLVVLLFITESPWGRVLRAVREDEEATMALGKNTFLYKLQAFAIGGALMGLAGWLFTITINYIEPSGSFAPAITFSVWVMVIVGGAGNLRGAIVGAFAIYGLEWLSVQLKDYAPQELKDTIFYIRLMIVGTLLIVLIIYRPEGILREKKRILR